MNLEKDDRYVAMAAWTPNPKDCPVEQVFVAKTDLVQKALEVLGPILEDLVRDHYDPVQY